MRVKPKSGLVAAAWSWLLPGPGHLYAGNRRKGIVIASAALVVYILAAVLLLVPEFKLNAAVVLVPAAGLGIFLFAIIDARAAVKEYNSSAGVSAAFAGPAMGAATLALVLLANPLLQAALVVGSFTGLPESMEPAVYAGDRLFVDLCAFRFLGIHRGDIIVYRVPGKPGKTFMHRVVGLPGETVELLDQEVRVNGAVLGGQWQGKRYYNRGDFGRKGQRVTVPAGSFYVLGDYSSRSDDSRFFGFVSKRNVVGRVFKRYYPFARSGRLE